MQARRVARKSVRSISESGGHLCRFDTENIQVGTRQYVIGSGTGAKLLATIIILGEHSGDVAGVIV